MPASRLKFESLPHAIFLQRVSGPQGATSLEARLGQGAFLALRLVDLLAPDRLQVSGDAFHYQSEEHTSELQSRLHLVCRILLVKKNAVRHGKCRPNSAGLVCFPVGAAHSC